jgi:hypothetical protein
MLASSAYILNGPNTANATTWPTHLPLCGMPARDHDAFALAHDLVKPEVFQALNDRGRPWSAPDRPSGT